LILIFKFFFQMFVFYSHYIYQFICTKTLFKCNRLEIIKKKHMYFKSI
jgi:hypothetical protein